ncbi:polysialyltransferase family glycosyltransferase [Flavobacterium sedimenticola]|uniref:Polysialyltransferase family glycosyltransferase n=1 Tax=Flavobacterium sedimenticola TaxID=3043286 RepID=A0ABT6XRM2_9FLAO|nr:polysialyltransferase family glycosyltransferase [Flavobacterium sedimenticola]MDI9257706.1 polysialyltransferase family glycosyltransferase [Flavobacterium sedimenticola]
MKHIFSIHNHITFLAAVGTIVYERIPTDQVVLLCGGQYDPDTSAAFKGKVVPTYDRLESGFSFFQKIASFNYTKKANHYLTQITEGEPFTAYVDVMSVFNRYLVMHPQCQQFHIIEEGIVNYADYDDFMLWTADLRQFDWQWNGFGPVKQKLNACFRLWRGRSLRLLAMPIHPNLYTLHRGVKAYCFSDVAFRYTQNEQKKILSWEGLTPYIKSPTTPYADGDWFWIGDTLCKSYGVRMEHFEKALQHLLERLNPEKTARTIYLKFRGGEPKAEQALTLHYLKAYGFQVVTVPPTEIMEMVFLQYKNLQVCGIASSLLIYAHLMGHQTHSLYAYLPDEYNISLAKSYPTIAKKVGFLL